MFTTFTHTLSGRSFTAEAAGSFGAASVDGRWDSGETGTIWPGETLRDGSLVWVAA